MNALHVGHQYSSSTDLKVFVCSLLLCIHPFAHRNMRVNECIVLFIGTREIKHLPHKSAYD